MLRDQGTEVAGPASGVTALTATDTVSGPARLWAPGSGGCGGLRVRGAARGWPGRRAAGTVTAGTVTDSGCPWR